MMIEKRSYVVPLRRKYANSPRTVRTKKAMAVLKVFLSKHMKSEEVRVGAALNEYLWKDGIRNPPGKVAIVAEKNDEGIVYAELEGHKLPSELEAKDEKASKKEDKKADTTKKETAKEEVEKKSESKEEKTSSKKSEEKPSEKKTSSQEKKSSDKKKKSTQKDE